MVKFEIWIQPDGHHAVMLADKLDDISKFQFTQHSWYYWQTIEAANLHAAHKIAIDLITKEHKCVPK